MRLVEDIQEIKDAITQVKEMGDEWYTNYYIADEVARSWIEKKQLRFFESKKTAFLLRQRGSFYLLYYFSSSIKNFSSSLRSLLGATKATFSVDILHKADSGGVEEIFLHAGFEKRVRLYRMRLSKHTSAKGKLPEPCYAERQDAGVIYTMLHQQFDEFCEQIPDIDEIEAAIAKSQILVIKERDMLVSFFWLERAGRTVLWRYWLTNPQYRAGSMAGIILLRQVMALHSDVMQTLLWVREDNPKVIRAHEKNGFQMDGLVDDVYCLIR